MAKVKQTVKTKTRVKKGTGNKKVRVCNTCRGTGYVFKK